MKRLSVLPLAVLATIGGTAPTMAWSTSVPAGDYRLTTTIQPAEGARSLRLSLAPHTGAIAAGTTLHAWFVDAEGMILGPASLGRTRADGTTLVALDPSLKIPTSAAALVVLAQPAPVRPVTGGGVPAATVTQIALPGEVTGAVGG